MNDLSGPLNYPLNYPSSIPTDVTNKPHAQQTMPGNVCTPKLEMWLELQISERVVICGVIYNHIKYPDGMRLLTSSVKDYKSDAEGRSYVLTHNSRYELGTKIEGEEAEHLLRQILATGQTSNPDLIRLRLRAMNALNVA